MTNNSVVNDINKKIKIHGSNIYGDPIFRVVFSDDEVESRHGTYRDYSGKIFVREVTEVRVVQKYPYIKSKWILERWAPGELSHHKDLVTVKDGVYVCVYIFQDLQFGYLPPLLKVAEIVINHLLHPRTKGEALSQDKEIEERNDEKEVDEIEKNIQIESDISKTKDMKSKRETMSEGYVKEKL